MTPFRRRREFPIGRRAVLAVAVVIVLAGAVGAWALEGRSRPRSPAVAVPPCRSTFTVVDAIDDDMAPGDIGITLANAGPHSCRVSTSPPTVLLIGPDGKPDGPALRREAWHSVVADISVLPRETVIFGVTRFLICHPSTRDYTLRVTLGGANGGPAATIDIPIGPGGRVDFPDFCWSGSRAIGTVTHLS